MKAPWTGRHVVYRAYNRAGSCIYVGATNAFSARIASHRTSAFFGPEIHRCKVTIHRNRGAALDAEATAIRALRPRYNIYGRGPQANWTACDFVEVIESLARRLALDPDRPKFARSPFDVDFLVEKFKRFHPEVAAIVNFDIAGTPRIAEAA